MATSEQFQNAVRLLSLTTLFCLLKTITLWNYAFQVPLLFVCHEEKKADNGCYHEDPSIPYLIYTLQ